MGVAPAGMTLTADSCILSQRPSDNPCVHVSGDTTNAGASAAEQADLYGELADQTQEQVLSLLATLRELRKREYTFRSGSEGERVVAQRAQQVIVDLGSTDWHILVDRKWPGTRRANLDLLLVGPPGIFVLDAKNWKNAHIEGDCLWRDQSDVSDELDKVRAQAEAVSSALTDLGLAPVAVESMLVLANHRSAGVLVQGVTVVGDQALQRELVRRGNRLDADAIATIVGHLEQQCPSATPAAAARRVCSASAVVGDTPKSTQDALIDADDIFAAAWDAAARGGIEQWMTWLKPEQLPLVTRSFAGPARIRGAAGTGKTVVALHRARHLARSPNARVLVTSFVRTLPGVYEGLFARLAPEATRHVEFRSLHSWAMRLLNRRGIHVDVTAASAVFRESWNNFEKRAELLKVDVPETYWRDEITSVIKARGIQQVEEYLALTRVGRRTPLREDQRLAVWALYEQYERRLREAYSHDWEDVLLLALESLIAEPLDYQYSSVIVDEVQDLNRVGVQLLHALVGDRPDGFLLIGDGQQSVYPGGFTLSEAGINVKGRSVSLTRNYRNTSQILRYALTHISSDTFSDLEAEDEPGSREVDVERDGGQVLEEILINTDEESRRLVELIRWTSQHGTALGDMAILVPSNRDVRRWEAVLQRAHLRACLLQDYDGRATDAIKIGTYQRAKGLEFACAFLPDFVNPDDPSTHPHALSPDDASLTRRQQFVAMTRARDRLWIGRVGGPTGN